MSGMRTVSLFGPEGTGAGGGLTVPDDGRGAAGGFGGGKKLVDEMSSGAVDGEDGAGEPPAWRTGN